MTLSSETILLKARQSQTNSSGEKLYPQDSWRQQTQYKTCIDKYSLRIGMLWLNVHEVNLAVRTTYKHR